MELPIAGTTLHIDDDRIDGTIEQKLEQYLAGERVVFDEKIDFSGFTDFQKRVFWALRHIPYGETVTYSKIAGFCAYAETRESFEYAELAECPENPSYARAIGNACGVNPVPVVVPCHRVVAKNGLGGYTGGIEAKKALLQLEDAHI